MTDRSVGHADLTDPPEASPAGPAGGGPRAARFAATFGADADRNVERLRTAFDLPASTSDVGAVDDTAAPTTVRVAGAGTIGGRQGWAWSHSPLPGTAGDDLDHTRLAEDAATVAVQDAGRLQVRTGISGAQGLYHWVDADGSAAVLASLPTPIVDAGIAAPTADWDAWAQIISTGGPLGDRTPFREVRRLGPEQALTVAADGRVAVVPRRWEWLGEVPEGAAGLDDVATALDDAVARQARRNPLRILLSGGWDSRVLATLAVRHDPATSAWTTSKDAGTAWEELIARQVALQLGLDHRLRQPDARAFEDDLHAYVGTVGYLTAYHVWLHHLARSLADQPGTVLDGLGGGVFFGGAFPPTVGVGTDQDRRFAQLVRYLRSAPGVLRPSVETQLTERSRAGFDRATRHLQGHREVDALSAYLTRTLPGIGHGPFGLVAAFSRAASPFLDHDVVTSSMAIPVADRRDRRLYPALLRRWARSVADLGTAVEPAPRHRRRPQRGACVRTATAVRTALVGHPVGELLHPRLRGADIATWQQHLESKADQHILRSLWMLALWLDHYRPGGDGPEVLARPTG